MIEVGVIDLRRKEPLLWEPVLKLGAKEGDTWEWKHPTSGDKKSFTLVKLGKDKDREIAIIREVFPVKGGEGAITHTYAKGIGEIARSEVFQPTAGQPAPNAPAGNAAEPKVIREYKYVE